MVVVAGLTIRVAGVEVAVCCTPSDQVSFHGPVPLSAAWIVAEPPAQIVFAPLTVAVGWFTVSVAACEVAAGKQAPLTITSYDPASSGDAEPIE